MGVDLFSLALLGFMSLRPFRVVLENPHIIQPQQIWAGVISKGPSGVSLSSSFKNRSEVAYKTELGDVIGAPTLP